MNRPKKSEYPKYYQTYIDKVPEGDLLELLVSSHLATQASFQNVGEINGNFRYAPGKWTLKEVLVHMIDCERVMAYRALAFSRNDQTALPGFDENNYVNNIDVSSRTIKDLMQEFQTVRTATISQFQYYSKKMLAQSGNANGNRVSVSALAYIILGHEIHHRNVIHERYLGAGMELVEKKE